MVTSLVTESLFCLFLFTVLFILILSVCFHSLSGVSGFGFISIVRWEASVEWYLTLVVNTSVIVVPKTLRCLPRHRKGVPHHLPIGMSWEASLACLSKRIGKLARDLLLNAQQHDEHNGELPKFISESHMVFVPCSGGSGSLNFTDDSKCNVSIFPQQQEGDFNSVLLEAVEETTGCCDRAVGALVGLVMGDAGGAPLEFLNSHRANEAGVAHLERGLTESGELKYVKELNRFRLKRGQWTDDSAMALCLADSLIVNDGSYDDGDCRLRYCNWWVHGYNNAFRHDTHRSLGRTSVGLGGNIADSLTALCSRVGNQQQRYRSVSECEEASSSLRYLTPVTAAMFPFCPKSKDSGNGSMMRLAPVGIRFHSDVVTAAHVAIASSLSTHGGEAAATCCAFLAFFVAKAIHREASIAISDFLSRTIAEFLAGRSQLISQAEYYCDAMEALLNSAPPSESEAVWNWRAAVSPFAMTQLVAATQKSRGHEYNGYPVSSGYFGSYCMDGLAMALYALNTTTTFADCLVAIVNQLGDADSTGAIACQMAGAFYGYRSFRDDPLTRKLLLDVQQWDPMGEIPMRALLLFAQGCQS